MARKPIDYNRLLDTLAEYYAKQSEPEFPNEISRAPSSRWGSLHYRVPSGCPAPTLCLVIADVAFMH
jgi:hypothetical protein